MKNVNTSDRAERAFAIVEAAAVVVVGAVLLAMLLVLGGESRRNARLGEDLAKLRQIGAWTGSYATDGQDILWTFSWKKGVQYVPTIPPASSDLEAAANQAVEILRRLADRPDMPFPVNWLPHTTYSHLVLEDYLKSAMPDPIFVSAADKSRLNWARDPYGFDACQYPPQAGFCGDPNSKRWPYSGSFQIPACFYDGSAAPSRISQAASHNYYFAGTASTVLGGRSVGEVAFPSQKALLLDMFGRHFGTHQLYFGYPVARVALLFADGSAGVRATSDSNPGWIPNVPASPNGTSYNYAPGVMAPNGSMGNTGQWEPPTLDGPPVQVVDAGRYRWTRGFLDGRDFGGPEVCTGQPGCP